MGEQLDELNGVAIYYNGGVNTVQGRNLTQDGYNPGLRRYGHVAIIASVGRYRHAARPISLGLRHF